MTASTAVEHPGLGVAGPALARLAVTVFSW